MQKGGGQGGQPLVLCSPAPGKMDLIIADSDHVYASALAARLKAWQAQCQIVCCQQREELHKLIAARKENSQPTFFLYNSDEFSELIHLAASAVWPEHWQVLAIENSLPATRPAAFTYSRFEPVSRLIEQLVLLADRQQANQLEPEKSGQPVLQTGGIWLAVSLCAGNGVLFCRQRLADLLASGRQIIYLPLLPTYEMDQIQTGSQGPNLSDLLLGLLGDSVTSQDLGSFWQPNPAGFFQFRPPARSDDLVTCDPDILRRLVLIIKDKLAADPAAKSLVFIACSGLPLATAAAVAVLCDVLEIELPQGASFPAVSAQIEAGRLLSLLPASCQVIRHIYPEKAS